MILQTIGLTMQAAFVQEYLIDRNGRAAAVRAGYSPKTAQEQSSRLLSIVKVKEAVNKGFQDHAKTCEITRESILKEYQKDIYDTVMGTVNNDTINQCITLVEWNTKDGL